jgi:prepilin-type N-terminal cleavage/methylation domain-containing protein/prepilin-type processing-associated H-X9-DG protein
MRNMGNSRWRPGFTLIELLTVVGIIGVLIALLLPALAGARRAAQATQCASNLRQLTAAMINYSVEFKGQFPGNRGDLDTYWYDRGQVGRYIKAQYGQSNSEQCIGGVFVCPGDLPGAMRSYSMNVYASGFVSSFVSARLSGTNPMGKLWRSGSSPSSNLILLIESYSSEDWPNESGGSTVGTGTSGNWASPALVGFTVSSPGSRFISGGFSCPARFGECESQVCYFRHRTAKQPASLGNAVGRMNIGFADGHVSLHSPTDLVDQNGRSTFTAMWSPNDRQIEAAIDQQQ